MIAKYIVSTLNHVHFKVVFLSVYHELEGPDAYQLWMISKQGCTRVRVAIRGFISNIDNFQILNPGFQNLSNI